jgi:hypothetical protein
MSTERDRARYYLPKLQGAKIYIPQRFPGICRSSPRPTRKETQSQTKTVCAVGSYMTFQMAGASGRAICSGTFCK